MNRSTGFLLILVVFTASAACGQDNCYTVVVGRSASADRSVLVAHNEDTDFVARLRKINRQADTSFACLWLEMPGRPFSHALLNEYGVAVVSNNCPSREDRGELTDSGVGPMLRILVAQKCRTAREGAHLVGELVGKYGYSESGRTLVIADRSESWLVALVRGKHWVAQRVPDSQVAVIANTYTIREVDLGDTLNFLGAADLVDYAVRRGWYDPAHDGAFSFERAYANQSRRVHPDQTHRQWSGLNRLAPGKIPPPGSQERLPFSVRPDSPVTETDLFRIARDHYEGTPYAEGLNNPHQARPGSIAATICNNSTASSSVFRLRSGLPAGIGACWSLALWHPCASPFLPIYLGLSEVPEQLDFDLSEKDYDQPATAVPLPPDKAYALFMKLGLAVADSYPERAGTVRAAWEALEDSVLAARQVLESRAAENLADNNRVAREALGRFCLETLDQALEKARGLLRSFR